MAGPRSPTSPVTAQLISRRWKTFSFWCYADFQQPSSEGLIVLPHNTVQLISRCYNVISFGWYEAFHKHSTLWLGRAPPNTAQFLSRCGRTFSFGCYAAVYKHSSLWLGQAPYIPCHGPAHFAALKNRIVLMLCRLWTTFKRTAGRAAPNTVQLISRCWRSSLSGWYEAFQKHSKLWPGCAPPNTAQILSRCEIFFSSGCYEDFQNNSNLWLGRAPPKGPAHFTVWKHLFVWMVGKFSKPPKFMAGPCSSKHCPVHFTVLKNLFVWMVWSLSKTFKNWAWAVLPQTRSQHPLSRPSSFCNVETSFHLDVMQIVNNARMNAWSCSPKPGVAHFTVLKHFFVWVVWNFSKTFKVRALRSTCS